MKLFFRFVTGDFVRRGPPMECDVAFFSDRKSLKILSVEFLPFEIKQQHQRKKERCVTTEKTAAEQTTGKSQSYNAVNEHPTLSRHTPRVS